jgi:hypothetical protein
MALHSVLEDVRGTTLQAIAGDLGRLEYLSRLRNQEGVYTHWGLARVYGDAATQRALAQAHRSLLSEILSTPFRKLLEEVEQSSESAGMVPTLYVTKLCELKLVPPEPGAGSERHLNSMMHALSSLMKSRKSDATLPTS